MTGPNQAPRARIPTSGQVPPTRTQGADLPTNGTSDAVSGLVAPVQHPAAMLYGPGHVVVYGNPPFQALFGAGSLGLPAAEALIDLPRAAFELMDLVYREGRALARWITLRGAPWRLTIVPRRVIGSVEVYGIAMHLVPGKRA
jgi:hypothetical protein